MVEISKYLVSDLEKCFPVRIERLFVDPDCAVNVDFGLDPRSDPLLSPSCFDIECRSGTIVLLRKFAA